MSDGSSPLQGTALPSLYRRGRRWIWRRLHSRQLRGQVRRISECPLFDAEWYLAIYPDVANHDINPLLHYLDAGAAEGRVAAPDPQRNSLRILCICGEPNSVG